MGIGAERRAQVGQIGSRLQEIVERDINTLPQIMVSNPLETTAGFAGGLVKNITDIGAYPLLLTQGAIGAAQGKERPFQAIDTYEEQAKKAIGSVPSAITGALGIEGKEEDRNKALLAGMYTGQFAGMPLLGKVPGIKPILEQPGLYSATGGLEALAGQAVGYGSKATTNVLSNIVGAGGDINVAGLVKPLQKTPEIFPSVTKSPLAERLKNILVPQSATEQAFKLDPDLAYKFEKQYGFIPSNLKDLTEPYAKQIKTGISTNIDSVIADKSNKYTKLIDDYITKQQTALLEQEQKYKTTINEETKKFESLKNSILEKPEIVDVKTQKGLDYISNLEKQIEIFETKAQTTAQLRDQEINNLVSKYFEQKAPFENSLNDLQLKHNEEITNIQKEFNNKWKPIGNTPFNKQLTTTLKEITNTENKTNKLLQLNQTKYQSKWADLENPKTTGYQLNQIRKELEGLKTQENLLKSNEEIAFKKQWQLQPDPAIDPQNYSKYMADKLAMEERVKQGIAKLQPQTEKLSTRLQKLETLQADDLKRIEETAKTLEDTKNIRLAPAKKELEALQAKYTEEQAKMQSFIKEKEVLLKTNKESILSQVNKLNKVHADEVKALQAKFNPLKDQEEAQKIKELKDNLIQNKYQQDREALLKKIQAEEDIYNQKIKTYDDSFTELKKAYETKITDFKTKAEGKLESIKEKLTLAKTSEMTPSSIEAFLNDELSKLDIKDIRVAKLIKDDLHDSLLDHFANRDLDFAETAYKRKIALFKDVYSGKLQEDALKAGKMYDAPSEMSLKQIALRKVQAKVSSLSDKLFEQQTIPDYGKQIGETILEIETDLKNINAPPEVIKDIINATQNKSFISSLAQLATIGNVEIGISDLKQLTDSFQNTILKIANLKGYTPKQLTQTHFGEFRNWYDKHTELVNAHLTPFKTLIDSITHSDAIAYMNSASASKAIKTLEKVPFETLRNTLRNTAELIGFGKNQEIRLGFVKTHVIPSAFDLVVNEGKFQQGTTEFNKAVINMSKEILRGMGVIPEKSVYLIRTGDKLNPSYKVAKHIDDLIKEVMPTKELKETTTFLTSFIKVLTRANGQSYLGFKNTLNDIIKTGRITPLDRVNLANFAVHQTVNALLFGVRGIRLPLFYQSLDFAKDFSEEAPESAPYKLTRALMGALTDLTDKEQETLLEGLWGRVFGATSERVNTIDPISSLGGTDALKGIASKYTNIALEASTGILDAVKQGVELSLTSNPADREIIQQNIQNNLSRSLNSFATAFISSNMSSYVNSKAYNQIKNTKGEDITQNYGAGEENLTAQYNTARTFTAILKNKAITAKNSEELEREKYASVPEQIKAKWAYMDTKTWVSRKQEFMQDLSLLGSEKVQQSVFDYIRNSLNMPKPPKQVARIQQIAPHLVALNNEERQKVINKTFKNMDRATLVDALAYTIISQEKKPFYLLLMTPNMPKQGTAEFDQLKVDLNRRIQELKRDQANKYLRMEF